MCTTGSSCTAATPVSPASRAVAPASSKTCANTKRRSIPKADPQGRSLTCRRLRGAGPRPSGSTNHQPGELSNENSAYHAARRRSATLHRLLHLSAGRETAAQEREQRVQNTPWPSSVTATRRTKPSSSSPTTGGERGTSWGPPTATSPWKRMTSMVPAGRCAPPAPRSPASRPGQGTTVIAFVEDPDGYKIELIAKKDAGTGLGTSARIRAGGGKTTGPRAPFSYWQAVRPGESAPWSGAAPPPAGSAQAGTGGDRRRSPPRWRSR